MILMLCQERQPCLHDIGVPVLNLDQPAHGNALEILLALLEDEVGSWYCPALGDAWERDGAASGKAHVVCCANGEIGEEKEVTDGIGAQLQIASWDSILRFVAQRSKVYGTDINGLAEFVKSCLRLRVEGFLLVGERDTAFPIGLLEARSEWIRGDVLCQLDGLNAATLVHLQ